MSKQPNGVPDAHEQPQSKSAAVVLISDIADTTWRMFIPTIGLSIIGLILDKKLGSAPWLMITGIVTGSALATLLTRRQLKKVQKL